MIVQTIIEIIIINITINIYANPKEFRSNNINYFDFETEDEDSIVLINKYIFYKNIYIFVDRLKNLIIIKDKKKIKKT